MNFKTLTLAQAILLVGLAASVVAAYRLLGAGAAGAIGAFGSILAAASSGKDPPAPPASPVAPDPNRRDEMPPPAARFLMPLAFALLSACVAAPDGAKVVHEGAGLGYCQDIGRHAEAGTEYATYAACADDGGL